MKYLVLVLISLFSFPVLAKSNYSPTKFSLTAELRPDTDASTEVKFDLDELSGKIAVTEDIECQYKLMVKTMVIAVVACYPKQSNDYDNPRVYFISIPLVCTIDTDRKVYNSSVFILSKADIIAGKTENEEYIRFRLKCGR